MCGWRDLVDFTCESVGGLTVVDSLFSRWFCYQGLGIWCHGPCGAGTLVAVIAAT